MGWNTLFHALELFVPNVGTFGQKHPIKDKEASKQKETAKLSSCSLFSLWALTDSNRRPSACKADALNQLS